MSKPIRVLHVLGSLDMGGIENFLMNIYRKIDKTKIQFDFLVHYSKKGFFEEEIKSLGGKIYRVKFINEVSHFEYLSQLNKFFKKYPEYKIVHSHYNTISGFILREAKKCNVPFRISHSHIANPKYKFLDSIYKSYSKSKVNCNSNIKFACSNEAGKWLFGKNKKYEIINNGIDIEKFLFDFQVRKDVRRELGLKDDEFAIVNIGRFEKQKNQHFLIKIMKELQSETSKIKLFLVGDGPLRDEINSFSKNLNNVVNLGIRSDISRLLNGMDLKIFPSLFEGLGIVAIEAQVNGLNVLASDRIPKEVDLGLNLYQELSLNSSLETWINMIKKLKLETERTEKMGKMMALKNSEFNIEIVVKKLENFYMMLKEKNEKNT